MTRIAAVQMTSSDSIQANLNKIESLIRKCVMQKAQLVALPENAVFIGKSESEKLSISEHFGYGPIQLFMSNLAKTYKIWLIGGTIPILTENKKHAYASCLVWNNLGNVIARYDKIHLFDVTINDTDYYDESQTIFPGNTIVSVSSPVGKLGLAICYDLRFPEMYRTLSLQEAVELIVIPSAFTEITGKAHWEILLRARAIENISYVVAPNQTGTHANGRSTYGHTMIIGPWGEILGCVEKEEDVVVVDINLAYLRRIRAQFPVLNHIKLL